jgi:DNA polymerase
MKCLRCPIALDNNFHGCPRQGDENHILWVGESPGTTENKTKIPFTGKSGKLLKSYITLYGLRDFSSFTNVVKCQPPRNRDPLQSEITNCASYLIEDIQIVKPKLIILVGKVALEVFINKKLEYIKEYINKPFIYNGVIVISVYHPSYILRESKEDLYFESFNIISDIYNKINPWHTIKTFKKKV